MSEVTKARIIIDIQLPLRDTPEEEELNVDALEAIEFAIADMSHSWKLQYEAIIIAICGEWPA
jgi:hypothetical protein